MVLKGRGFKLEIDNGLFHSNTPIT